MSDRTRVTEHADAGSDADGLSQSSDADVPTTRADRIMGRTTGESRGSGTGSSSGPGGATAAAGSSSSRASGVGSAAQRPTSVPGSSAGSAGRSTERSGGRPSDGWGRTSGSAASSADHEVVEDETPTRVNPAVPRFRTPLRESPGAGGSDPAPEPSATAEPVTTDTAAQPAVGAGSLGTVARSMDEPAEGTAPSREASSEQPRSVRPKARKARRARLRLSRIDPWSVMKTSFLFSIALGIASWVAVAFVWWVIQQSGLLGAVNEIVTGILQTPGDADPFRLEAYVNGSRVLGLTALLAVVDVVLITALLTVASFLYNLSATMLGGLQVTLAETDD